MADNTVLNAGTGGDTIATDDIGGVKHQRVKAGFGADGAYADAHNSNPFPVVQHGASYTYIQYWATGVGAAATGTESLITMNRASGTAAATTATSFVITSGKRYRITSITFASRGHATATAQVTTFTLRINTAGAIAVGSAARFAARTATPATALAWDRVTLSLPAEGIDIVGDGTLQFGVTASAVYTTNAPTWDVLITGFEY